MGKADPLIIGIHKGIRANRHGSYKTQHNNISEATHFVKALRELGFGVNKWKNITNKHVGAVVRHWTETGLAVGTIKSYLSGVRRVCSIYNKESNIHKNNSAFGLKNRVYVDNRDKSIDRETYSRVVDKLKSSENIEDKKVAAQLMLQRELGLRNEESRKFDPNRSVMHDGRIFVHFGTKGGRDRCIDQPSENAMKAIEYAKTVISGKNLIPDKMTEKQWEKQFYRIIRKHGISRTEANASCHGLRHLYTQERYERITGFKPPCKFESKQDFKINAERSAGNHWRKLDRDARQILMTELGHGPDRNDVISQYIGSV